MLTRAVPLLVVGMLAALTAPPTAGQAADAWTRDFALDGETWSSLGRNPYFILEPGYVLEFQGGTVRLVITVLDETRRIAGVEARVVEERETDAGRLVEVSRNYFALSTRTNSVFYFGEDVDIYKGGKVVSHEGAWLTGVNGARPGLMMAGLPLLRARYYQEVAPGVAMDRAEVSSLTDTMTTPAGVFRNVLRVSETTPLEPAVRDSKYYARDVGLISDGSVVLVKYSGPGTLFRGPS